MNCQRGHFFPFAVRRLVQFLHTARAHTRFIMPMRTPLPRPTFVASDATLFTLVFVHDRSGFTYVAPRTAFQTHNELFALLKAVLTFRRLAVFLTDSTAVLSLRKRSTYALPLKNAVAAFNPEIRWVPSSSNPADGPSRALRFGRFFGPRGHWSVAKQH